MKSSEGQPGSYLTLVPGMGPGMPCKITTNYATSIATSTIITTTMTTPTTITTQPNYPAITIIIITTTTCTITTILPPPPPPPPLLPPHLYSRPPFILTDVGSTFQGHFFCQLLVCGVSPILA